MFPLRTCIAVIWILLSALSIQAAITIRIRLSNGSMQRFEVDEEKETVYSLRERLINQGIITGEDVSFILKDQSYLAQITSTSTSTSDQSALLGNADPETVGAASTSQSQNEGEVETDGTSRGSISVLSEDVQTTDKSSVRSQKYSAATISATIDEKEVFIKSLNVCSGDIINIIKPSIPKDVTKIKKETKLSSTLSTESTQKNIVNKSKSSTPKKGVNQSIADYDKKKRSLLKITRQKSTHGRSVSMTSTAGRIFNRLADKGGYGLLLGEY